MARFIICILLSWSGSLWGQTYQMDGSLTLINDCGGFFTDSGGSSEDYANNENFLTTICKDPFQGTHVRLTLSQIDLATGDKLCIYDGLDTNADSLICIESYGAIVYRALDDFEEVKTMVSSYEEKIKAKGYGIASALSTPPMFAGGSWKSYTTFTYGMKIDDEVLYKMLFQNLEPFDHYDSLFHYLKQEGYTNYLLCPLGNYVDGQVDWNLIQKNFQSDVFLNWDKIDYKGAPVSFMEMMHSPPDQYSIHKAKEIIAKDNTDPHCLFFCSLNSHVPFNSPKEIVADWRSLDKTSELNGTTGKDQKDFLERYKQAIKYQLDYVCDYILKQENENTIFVLFGDHQPPVITKEKMGFETPVHIIARDPDVVQHFLDNGFTEGLIPEDVEKTTLKHEGFYTLFMQALNKRFGANPSLKLPYLPTGVLLEKEVVNQ